MNFQFTEEQIKSASDAITAMHGPGPDSDGMWRDGTEYYLRLIHWSIPEYRIHKQEDIRALAHKLQNIARRREKHIAQKLQNIFNAIDSEI